MIRVQVFGSFLAAGVCFGLLAPALTSPSEPGWDSRESKSDLFDQQTSPSASQAVYASTVRTLSKWEGRRTSHAVGKSRTVSGQPMGAVLSLVSFSRSSSVLTTCQDGPDNNQPPVSSISTPDSNYGSNNCSTTANFNTQNYCSANVPSTTQNPPANTLCSIGITKTPPTGVTYCTSNTQTTTPGTSPLICSTQGGISINNPPSTNGSVGCSACGYDDGNPGVDAYTCSANGSIVGGSCSTAVGNHQACTAGMAMQGGDQLNCSTSQWGGNNASFCSVSNPATGGAFGNKCSAIAMQPGQNNGGAVCSVNVSFGAGGSCSVDQKNTGGTNNTMCTVYYGSKVTPSNTFYCSAYTQGAQTAKGNCSVLNGGVLVGDGPVNGVCGGPYSGHD